MARITYRRDHDKRFKSTVDMWPLEEGRLIRIPFKSIERDFALPSRFVKKFGDEFRRVVYAIDDQDNATEILYVENQFGLKYDPTTFDESEFEPSDMSDDSLSTEKSDYTGLKSHFGTEESSDPGQARISLCSQKRKFYEREEESNISAKKSKRSTTIKRSKKKNTHKVPNTRYLDWGKFKVTLNTPILTTINFICQGVLLEILTKLVGVQSGLLKDLPIT
ncbi:hypothetical protein PIB30_075797 [Stylosanthes scabra]|uniref:Uncharacterized protein n=1 Tax=Stylosanthes scabra TaxID=79078 RepID=A0ABU6TRJ8_9FABA|nr:hypothetical protein [Stylosanthes scabra]